MRENYYLNSSNYQQQQQPRPRRFKKFDYLRDDDFDDERAWHWNMSHQQSPRYNGSSAVSTNSNKSKRNASDRSSGIQSFFRWFKKDDKNRNSKDIRYPREITSSTDTLEYDDNFRSPQVQFRKKLRDINQSPSSPRRSYGFSQSSSCDSVFSTASSFAFVPPIKYLLNRNQRQVCLSYFQGVKHF